MLSDQHIVVPVQATGAVVLEASLGDEATQAVALGFERCGSALRDLLALRAQHGTVPDDDHLLAPITAPCTVEMRQMLESSSPEVLTTELLSAFCKGTGAPSVTPKTGETKKEALVRRLCTYLNRA